MRRSLVWILGIALVGSLTLDSASAAEWKIATMLPEGSRYLKVMKDGARNIAQSTRGRVEIRFFAGGIMGDDEAVLSRIRNGELHGAAVAGPSLGKMCPICLAYSLPMEFRSFEEAAYVRARMDPTILESLNKSGLICLGIAGGGFAYVMSTRPAEDFEDFRRLKLWVPPQESFAEMVKATGLNPVPSALADVRNALQSGTIEAVIASPVGAIVQQWHAEIKHAVEMPILYLYAVLVVDRRRFAELSPEDQKVVREVMGRCFAELGQLAQTHDTEALDVLRKQGVRVQKPSAEAIEKWKSWAQTLEDQMARSGTLPKDTISEVTKLLDALRTEHPQGDRSESPRK